MAAFDLDAVTEHPADYSLVSEGGVVLFLHEQVLVETQEALRDLGYEFVSLDATGWDEEALHQSLANALAFPPYYGRNHNALNDCLGDIAHGDYGWSPERSTGLATIVRGFGQFARRQPTLARHLAATFVRATRDALLFGHRIVWLLQVDDPDFRLVVGSHMHLPWNGREWLDASRR